MAKLISKTQHRNFETGEFIDIRERDYDETISLIEDFPWTKEREKIVIDLTNPSVTIEGKNGDFLKLALFFNQKYVLHYLDTDQHLFTKSIVNLRDAYPYIQSFFSELVFSPADFRRETGWMQDNLKHFMTQDFRYTVTSKRARKFFISTCGLQVLVGLFFIAFCLYAGSVTIPWVVYTIMVLYIFFIGGGINLILFFTYYRYAKNKILIMSKANDIFYFGDANQPVQYNKKDIMQYTVIHVEGSRNPVREFAIVNIEFNDASEIQIPNIFVSDAAMENKLAGCQGSLRVKCPWLSQ